MEAARSERRRRRRRTERSEARERGTIPGVDAAARAPSGGGKAENARDAGSRENEGSKIRGRSVDATQGEKMPV